MPMIEQLLKESARIAAADVLKLIPEEQVLIITNPGGDAEKIAHSLYGASIDSGAFPVLVYQQAKTQFDFAEPAVIAAFHSRPQVVISVSKEKLGKDRQGISSLYEYEDEEYDHIFHLLLYGEKSCRSFWSPGTTLESFIRTVPIDYTTLRKRCDAISKILSMAMSVRVCAPGGTDICLGLNRREAKADDGNFSAPGKGGNLPAGETFISPENGTANGIIVFDGSISLFNKDIIIANPVHCLFRDGFIAEISGRDEAKALETTVQMAERDALEYEKTGRLPKGHGTEYSKNARNLGELGIGLNPAARITGGMLEDEKAFRTCHFAVGHNYDNDAPALIHLDGLVKEPTLTALMADGTSVIIEQDGELQI
jgi:leucyl aminopeptidase (aminopeptidase T)